MEQIETGELVRLPLWKNCLEAMIDEGVEYGKTYPAEFFEKELRCLRDSMRFGLDISYIRRELEKLGYYLSGRGQNGNAFVVLQQEGGVDVLGHYSHLISDYARRAVHFGAAMKTDRLTAEQKRKHEQALEKAAIKAELIQRSGTVAKSIRKHDPKLLE